MVFRLYWKQAGDRQNMIIRQLNIKNSGEIHDKTLEFSPGINVLYGENESERAIVHTYIKNMFLWSRQTENRKRQNRRGRNF